jgi:hypothetical protein
MRKEVCQIISKTTGYFGHLWLARREPDDKDSVPKFLTMAQAELERLTGIARKLFPLNGESANQPNSHLD